MIDLEEIKRYKKWGLFLLLLGVGASATVFVFKALNPTQASKSRTPFSTSASNFFSSRASARTSDEESLPPELQARLGKKPEAGFYGADPLARSVPARQGAGGPSGLASADDFGSSSLAYVGAGGRPQAQGISGAQALSQRPIISREERARAEGSFDYGQSSSQGNAPLSSSEEELMANIGYQGAVQYPEVSRSQIAPKQQSATGSSGEFAVSRQGARSLEKGTMSRARQVGKTQTAVGYYGGSSDRASADLRRRRDIAYQSESGSQGRFGSLEEAAGALNVAMGDSPKSGSPSGAPGRGAQATGSVDFGGQLPSAPSEETLPQDVAGSQQETSGFMSWGVTWEPKIIEAGNNCEACARSYIKSKWDSFAADWENVNRGTLASFKLQLDKYKEIWGLKRSFFEDVVGWLSSSGQTCESFYTDVRVTLTHPHYGTRVIDDCSAWLPAPYSAGRCVPGSVSEPESYEGFETSLPSGFDPIVGPFAIDPAKGIVKTGIVPAHINGNPVVIPKSEFYYQGGRLVGNSSDILRIGGLSNHLGAGIWKFTYGICTGCNTSPNHPTAWVSFYFNLTRNFDGTASPGQEYNRRCMPAVMPFASLSVKCNQAANCEFAKKCPVKEIRKLLETDLGFRQLARANPNKTSEEVCDIKYGLKGKVQQCIDFCSSFANANECNPETWFPEAWDQANQKCKE